MLTVSIKEITYKYIVKLAYKILFPADYQPIIRAL